MVEETPIRLMVHVNGIVQGVGFRPYVFRLACEFGLQGRVWNHAGGVEIEVEGSEREIRKFVEALQGRLPHPARIDEIETQNLPFLGYQDFQVDLSSKSPSQEILVTVMPDLATCDLCLSEFNDPLNRRYRYPFINCTQCGPRYSIVESLPYDRPSTTMKSFRMCDECQREYDDPRDRRFHAQPNACFQCGPHLAFHFTGKESSSDRALEFAVQLLKEGGILALKGVGGFQLLVDATNERSVLELRRRKRRRLKPFAVMMSQIELVSQHCCLNHKERALLQSPEAPIVLLRRDASSLRNRSLAQSVAPDNPYLGVMLPYSPLHHLLMREFCEVPLIATSGNLSEEPICIDEREAKEALSSLADGFLIHNRPIFRPMDDSVVQVVGGKTMLIRRARGYAPLPIGRSLISAMRSGAPSEKRRDPSFLALGGELKNAVAILKRDEVVMSQHIGDLGHRKTLHRFESEVRSLLNLYEMDPESVLCDLHPDYHGTLWGDRHYSSCLVGVQHHRAHIYSCFAESGQTWPCKDDHGLGICWDGTGWGDDGTIWGGEFFRFSEDHSLQPLLHFRPFPLLGGEQAVREPQRIALALLYEFLGDALFGRLKSISLFSHLTEDERKWYRSMLKGGSTKLVQCRSVGRLFDGVSSILGFSGGVEFEAQAAIQLEHLAERAIDNLETFDPQGAPRYRFLMDEGRSEILWGPVVGEILSDLECGCLVQEISLKFHVGLAHLILEIARREKSKAVFLSGGVFQNRLLIEFAKVLFDQERIKLYWQHQIPPNDGGIALGQIIAQIGEI